MYSDVLSQLLDLDVPDIYVDVDTESGMKRMKIDSSAELLTMSLNIILVLEGRRRAYRDDTNLGLSEQVLAITEGDLAYLPLLEQEPLVVLKGEVAETLRRFREAGASSDQRNAYHMLFGDVLGYPYIDDLRVKYSKKYTINYMADDVNLYGFCVPHDAYTEEIHSRILSDIESLSSTLTPYGYGEVTTRVMSDENGTWSILDSLPLPRS